MAQDVLLDSSRWKDKYSQQGLEARLSTGNQLSHMLRTSFLGFAG